MTEVYLSSSEDDDIGTTENNTESSNKDLEISKNYKYPFTMEPFETDLKHLLIEASGTSDIDNLCEVKLNVVTQNAGLHRLAKYTPHLRILILDGSCVGTLRDLGSYLKSLTTLSVSRCSLKSLDGICGFRNLRTFIARDNFVSDPSPCSGVSKLVKLDLTNNNISDIIKFAFLQTCTRLYDLSIAHNQFNEYRSILKDLLPQIKIIDGIEIDASDTDFHESGSAEEGHLTSDDESLTSFFDDGRIHRVLNELTDSAEYSGECNTFNEISLARDLVREPPLKKSNYLFHNCDFEHGN